jgi:hypothetical protein
MAKTDSEFKRALFKKSYNAYTKSHPERQNQIRLSKAREVMAKKSDAMYRAMEKKKGDKKE